MKKFWLVFWYEYRRHVLRWRFLFALVSVPIGMAALFAVSIFSSLLTIDTSPIGYVDQSGFLSNPVKPDAEDVPFIRPVEVSPYKTEADAKQALSAGEIQGYFILPAGFAQNPKARYYYEGKYSDVAVATFSNLIKANLLVGQPKLVVERINKSNDLVIESADGKRTWSSDNWANIVIPLASGLLFMIVIMSSGGYLQQAIVDEKENRTIEIIATSVSSNQLMAGKILGNLSVGLTQFFAWLSFGVLTLLIGRSFFGWLPTLNIDTQYVLLLLASLVLASLLIGSLMAAIGASVTETREGQQITGIFILPLWIPYWFVYPIILNPNSPLAVGLSFFPLTSPTTMALRVAFTEVPIWQTILMFIILIICDIAAVWIAARTFRIGMMRYGKRLSLREIFNSAGKTNE